MDRKTDQSQANTPQGKEIAANPQGIQTDSVTHRTS